MAIFTADNINVKREAMDQKDEHLLVPKMVMHGHGTIGEMTNEQLDRIIAGDFTAIEDASGGGAQTSPNGDGKPA